MTEFQEKVALIALQYVGAALILVFVGYWFNRSLEKYKSSQALASGLARQRIDALSACWSSMYSWEATVREIVVGAAELKIKHGGDIDAFRRDILTELAPVEERSKQQYQAARATIEASRFWLGEKFYLNFQSYSAALIEYGNAFVESDLSKLRGAESRLAVAKKDVVQTLGEFS